MAILASRQTRSKEGKKEDKERDYVVIKMLHSQERVNSSGRPSNPKQVPPNSATQHTHQDPAALGEDTHTQV